MPVKVRQVEDGTSLRDTFTSLDFYGQGFNFAMRGTRLREGSITGTLITLFFSCLFLVYGVMKLLILIGREEMTVTDNTTMDFYNDTYVYKPESSGFKVAFSLNSWRGDFRFDSTFGELKAYSMEFNQYNTTMRELKTRQCTGEDMVDGRN